MIARASLKDVTEIVKLSQANDPEHGGMLLGHYLTVNRNHNIFYYKFTY